MQIVTYKLFVKILGSQSCRDTILECIAKEYFAPLGLSGCKKGFQIRRLKAKNFCTSSSCIKYQRTYSYGVKHHQPQLIFDNQMQLGLLNYTPARHKRFSHLELSSRTSNKCSLKTVMLCLMFANICKHSTTM